MDGVAGGGGRWLHVLCLARICTCCLSSALASTPLNLLPPFSLAAAAGLTRGFGITLLRDTPSYGLYFVAYEFMVEGLQAALQLPPLGLQAGSSCHTAQFLAGGLAGMVAWLSVYPVDVVKTRMQVRLPLVWGLARTHKPVMWGGCRAFGAGCYKNHQPGMQGSCTSI